MTATHTIQILKVVSGPDRKVFALSTERPTTIGRDKDCDIFLDDLRCSRVHAIVRFDQQDGGWWLMDQNSSNGTYVNGSKVHETQLGFGAEIRIGSVDPSVPPAGRQTRD